MVNTQTVGLTMFKCMSWSHQKYYMPIFSPIYVKIVWNCVELSICTLYIFDFFAIFSFRNLINTEPKRWTSNHMCVQDTFEHKRNVTHKITENHIKGFKDFCAKSFATIQAIGPSVKYWNIRSGVRLFLFYILHPLEINFSIVYILL